MVQGGGKRRAYVMPVVVRYPSHDAVADPVAERLSIRAKWWSEWQDLNLRPPRPERGAALPCGCINDLGPNRLAEDVARNPGAGRGINCGVAAQDARNRLKLLSDRRKPRPP